MVDMNAELDICPIRGYECSKERKRGLRMGDLQQDSGNEWRCVRHHGGCATLSADLYAKLPLIYIHLCHNGQRYVRQLTQ